MKPPSGQLCPLVTKVFACAARCVISYTVYCGGLWRGVVYLLNGIGMRCDHLTLLFSELLGIPEFMQKTEFRAKVLEVARSKIDVEHERGKKAKSDAVAKTVMGESFTPFIDQGRQHIKYVAKELMRHPTFK